MFQSLDQNPLPVDTPTTSRSSAPIILSCGFPPVPAKLVKRIQDGLFIEMSELLPERLTSAEYNAGDSAVAQRQKPQEVMSILQWVQCFGVYIAIVSRTEPERTADLLGYQQLIINSSQHGQQGHWIMYDHHFRLKASATKCKDWSAIDINIWNMAFPDRTAATAAPRGYRQSGSGVPIYPPRQPFTKYRNVCLDWNDNPNPNCPYPDCRYEHRCYRCIFNPKVTDNQHKALFCPHKGTKAPLLQQPATGNQSKPY